MKPSTRTNARRKVLRHLAAVCEEWASCEAVHSAGGSLRIGKAEREALGAIREEMLWEAGATPAPRRGRSAP